MSEQKIYNKLIRDRIPEIIQQDSFRCEVDVLEPSDYANKLNQKLKEELKEYYEKEDIGELADLVEVVYAILAFRGVCIEEFEKIRLDKKLARGGFEKRLYLKKVLRGG